MKLAFISDIHGNATALEAVINDIEAKGVDHIVVLGDICFRGPEPKRALELIRKLSTNVIKGNADEWLIRGIKSKEVPEQSIEIMKSELAWTLEELDSSDIEYLKNLPANYELTINDKVKICCFHATPDSLFDVVDINASIEEIEKKLIKNNNFNVFLYGHIHVPYIKFINGKCVANLGSVGLSFDGLNYASYLMMEVNSNQYSISIHRVKYDVEKVLKLLKNKNYPNYKFIEGVILRE